MVNPDSNSTIGANKLALGGRRVGLANRVLVEAKLDNLVGDAYLRRAVKVL